MEPAGNNNGGFHGYQRIPQPTSNVTAPEVTMGLPPPPPQNNHHAGNGTNTDDTECIFREHDRRFMPLANVIRIMRRILPKHAKISDDAKATVQESVSEFIRLITEEANDRCQSEHRKTVTAEDLLWAMRKLGFNDYIEPLSLYLHRYREFVGSSRGEPMVQRMVDPSCLGFPRISPAAFHQTAAQDAFVGVAPLPMNCLLKDAGNGEARSSQAAFRCDEPFPLGDKEKF